MVSIDASSPTLALHNGDAMLGAEGGIEFRFGTLMMAVDNRRRRNPREECGFSHTLHKILLDSQVFG